MRPLLSLLLGMPMVIAAVPVDIHLQAELNDSNDVLRGPVESARIFSYEHVDAK